MWSTEHVFSTGYSIKICFRQQPLKNEFCEGLKNKHYVFNVYLQLPGR